MSEGGHHSAGSKAVIYLINEAEPATDFMDVCRCREVGDCREIFLCGFYAILPNGDARKLDLLLGELKLVLGEHHPTFVAV